jgi:hypothetical protein
MDKSHEIPSHNGWKSRRGATFRGGADTTAVGLLAGCPTVPCPFGLDQVSVI